MSTQSREIERLDNRIRELEDACRTAPASTPLVDRLFELYPSFIKQDFEAGKCVLLSGIDFDKLNWTEAAYFLSKDPQYPRLPDPDNKEPVPEPPPRVEPDEDAAAEYCICRKSQSAAADLISCDNCQQWFHPFCLRVSRRELALICQASDSVRWYCPSCLRKS